MLAGLGWMTDLAALTPAEREARAQRQQELKLARINAAAEKAAARAEAQAAKAAAKAATREAKIQAQAAAKAARQAAQQTKRNTAAIQKAMKQCPKTHTFRVVSVTPPVWECVMAAPATTLPLPQPAPDTTNTTNTTTNTSLPDLSSPTADQTQAWIDLLGTAAGAVLPQAQSQPVSTPSPSSSYPGITLPQLSVEPGAEGGGDPGFIGQQINAGGAPSGGDAGDAAAAANECDPAMQFPAEYRDRYGLMQVLAVYC